MWGLRAPARVAWDGGPRIECEDQRDVDRARGFVDAAAAMPAMDLARRTWSGRLAEVFGERAFAGVPAPELDWFVRILGFRRAAERAFRTADAETLEAYAAGVNAWIDAGGWSDEEVWGRLGTRPRLWGAADTLLIARAPAEADGGLGGDRPDGWTEAQERRVQTLWGALLDPELRAPGALAGPTSTWTPDSNPTRGRPALEPITILPGDDNLRVAAPDGSFHRLRARREDLTVRGAPIRRIWVRRDREAGVISDQLGGADEALPPAGPAFVLRWTSASEAVTARAHKPLTEPMLPAPKAVPSTLLVPLERGA